MQASRLLSNQVIRQCTRRKVHYDQAPVQQSTYNDLPQPRGSWKTHYDANQRKYNAHLALGVGVFIGSILFGKSVGYLEFYNDIPARPADIESYR
ncbi:unnamed protein product [Phaedon cochleariae]|uniref:Deltamethrin resistance protein prag01 domain-containing protein n=1 Tax=Phaedon cochleariae TaxID=80249 RepID=A0A9P0DSQ1_PHACE|nr:unnamed protein product [Phaedon cochleariae]